MMNRVLAGKTHKMIGTLIGLIRVQKWSMLREVMSEVGKSE